MAEIKQFILYGQTGCLCRVFTYHLKGLITFMTVCTRKSGNPARQLAFPEDSEVLLVEDYTARTNICADFISSGGNKGEIADILPANNAAYHQKDELFTENLLTRYSMDKCHVNSHGRDLLEFCKGAVFTRGQYWPRGIVVSCVRLSVTKFFRTITHHPFKLGSPNLDHRY